MARILWLQMNRLYVRGGILLVPVSFTLLPKGSSLISPPFLGLGPPLIQLVCFMCVSCCSLLCL